MYGISADVADDIFNVSELRQLQRYILAHIKISLLQGLEICI